jgi:uncharacterized membrane protein YbhN (UPF0104 family)
MLSESTDDAPALTPRRRLHPGWRALATAVIGVISVALLLWVAPPHKVIDQIGDMSLPWVLAGVGLEIGSCLGYVVIFRHFFPEPPRRVSRQVAWISMGAGAVLPGGNISSAAATGWLLRKHGIGTKHLLERCGALLCWLTAFGFFVNGVCGVLLLAHFPGGPHDILHTGGPILVSVAVLSGAAGTVLLPAGSATARRCPCAASPPGSRGRGTRSGRPTGA